MYSIAKFDSGYVRIGFDSGFIQFPNTATEFMDDYIGCGKYNKEWCRQDAKKAFWWWLEQIITGG